MWPNTAKCGQIQAKHGKMRPNTGQTRQNEAKQQEIQPNTAKFSQTAGNTAKYSQIQPNAAKHRQNQAPDPYHGYPPRDAPCPVPHTPGTHPVYTTRVHHPVPHCVQPTVQCMAETVKKPEIHARGCLEKPLSAYIRPG